VYADYLDENGEPDRAEFIRVQIELAKLPIHDPRRDELETRGDELLAPHKSEWGLPEFRGQSQVMHRGFVEKVNVEARWLVARPRVLTAAGPLRAMRVFGASAFIHRLAEVPGLARLETLDLTNTHFAGPDDVREFFAAARLDRLRELVLRNSNFWEGEEIAALADTPVAPRLRRLDVSGNRLSDAGARVLAERPEFGNLEVLSFRADELEHHSCVHAAGAEALAESTTLTRLKSLDLGDHYLGDEGVRALVYGPNAGRLERLGVEYNEIGESGDDGLLGVVESPWLTSLRELLFGGNQLGPLGADALANWPHLENMTVVDLRECPLSPTVQATLRSSPWAGKFVTG
jgi:hypothetical protein